jgi:hypothetical protein
MGVGLFVHKGQVDFVPEGQVDGIQATQALDLEFHTLEHCFTKFL